MNQDSYRSIKAGAVAEGYFEDRKSKFLAYVAHAETQEEAQAFIDEIKARHHDARHNVPTWILADGFMRTSDDGEPQRTAGLPCLQVLQSEDMKNVVCVVTRYFGGVLLGPGGLIRAYTQATQDALANAEKQGIIAVFSEVVQVDVSLSYSLYEQVLRLAQAAGARVLDTEFTDSVVLHLLFLAGEQTDFVAQVKELALGKDLCHVSDTYYGEF